MDQYLCSRSALEDPLLPTTLCSDWKGFFRKQVYLYWLEHFGKSLSGSTIFYNILSLELTAQQLHLPIQAWTKAVDDETCAPEIRRSACYLFETYAKKKVDVQLENFTNMHSFYSWRVVASLGVKIVEKEHREYFRDMMDHLIEIIPEEPEQYWFSRISLSDDDVEYDLEHFACELFQRLLAFYPAHSRQWFSDHLQTKTATQVRAFVQKYISEKIRSEELASIRAHNRANPPVDPEIEDFRIRVVGDDVLCKYVFQGDEDIQLEMEINLPNDYPLTAAKVKLTSKTGVDSKRERAWQFKLACFMSKAEVGIVEALNTWKKLVDQEFEGVEACAICYSVVYGGAGGGDSKALPKIYCKVCKHKYHAKCIYKWFQTSNNNTCPLCRTPMIF